MYKVFFNESCFLLTDDNNLMENNLPDINHTDIRETGKQIYHLLEQPDAFYLTIYHPDINYLLSDFKSLFTVVGAAGGVVRNAGKILMIKRFGMLDLPKGHIEEGEKKEECAIREVEEECGITGLKIQSRLEDTWHIYSRNNSWHLKQTFWFRMSCLPDQVLKPQTEEDIEDVFWLPAKRIPQILSQTYASLRPLLQSISL